MGFFGSIKKKRTLANARTHEKFQFIFILSSAIDCLLVCQLMDQLNMNGYSFFFHCKYFILHRRKTVCHKPSSNEWSRDKDNFHRDASVLTKPQCGYDNTHLHYYR